MVFSSLIFLFAFLPAAIICNLLGGKAMRNVILLVCSLFFYAWGEGLYVLIMLFSIIVNYCTGLLIHASRGQKSSKVYLTAGVVINLLVLVVFKYANFIVDNVNTVTEAFSLGHINVAQVHLPIGISFFTFQAISYIVDVYTGKTTKQKNIIKVAVYISMFPQLIAGPIVRFCDISRQLSNRVISSENLASGIRRFVIGLGKKVLIANTIAEAVDQIFLIPGAELPMAVAWLGAIGYTLQIYFDFSGYSDMAIGLGRIFGFTYLENFNYPYISRSIREFWRRWHISLSSWFRDYVYFPLGGSRKGKARTYANLLVVFLLCGLWHGASWNFIVWGLLHGGCMVLERVGAERMRVKLWPPLCHLYALLIIIVSWVLFRAETLSAAGHYLQSMFGASQGDSLKFYLSMYVNLEIGVALCLGLLFSTPLYPRLKMYVFQTLESCEKDTPGASARMSLEFAWLVVIFVVLGISIINLASGAYNPFIYFRF